MEPSLEEARKGARMTVRETTKRVAAERNRRMDLERASVPVVQFN